VSGFFQGDKSVVMWRWPLTYIWGRG